MPQTVTVLARHAFEHGGRTYAEGDPVITTPIEAAVLGRQGHVNTSKQTIQNRQMKAETPAEPTPRGRRRKQYRRADMITEGSEQ